MCCASLQAEPNRMVGRFLLSSPAVKLRLRRLLPTVWLIAIFLSSGPQTNPSSGKPGTTIQARAVSLQQPAANSDPQPARYASRFVTVNGTRLHYIVQGSGRPIVLIHGNPGSAQDWMPVLTPLALHHRVIAFDRPGHGHSHRPKHGEATVEVQAQLIHDALAQLSVVRPIIVGHSWAGALALVYAINYAKEVAGVLVVAPAVYESHDGDSFFNGLSTVPVISDAASYVLPPLLGSSMIRRMLKKAFLPDPVPMNYLHTALTEWNKPGQVKAYFLDDSMFNSSLRKFSPLYPEITVHLSILAGDSDAIVSGRENALRLHEAVPQSRLVVLPRTGHEVPFTRPKSVIGEIERLLRLSPTRMLRIS
jgi:pimeloyl-ACP methyl ester carboxylesterase